MTPHDIDAASGKVLSTHPAKKGTSQGSWQVAKPSPAVGLAPTLATDPVGCAIHWAEAARRSEIMGLFSRIMTGFSLREVKRQMGVVQGERSDLAADPRLKDGWAAFVKKTLGISDELARQWMKLSEAMQPRIKKLGKIDPAALLDFSSLDAAQLGALQKAISKLCDGQTYNQLALDLGILKKPKGAGAKGGDKGHGGGGEPLAEEAPDGWTQGDWDLYRDLAVNNPAAREAWDKWEPLIKALENEGLDERTWAALPDRLHARLHSVLSELLKLVPAKISTAKSTTKKN